MDIRYYALVNSDDEIDSEEFDTLAEARNAVAEEDEPHAVVELVYTLTDTELVWAPDGSDTWPPVKP